MSLLYLILKRFVIGETRTQAILHTTQLNKKHIGVILNHLGEHIRDPHNVKKEVEEYLKLINLMKKLNKTDNKNKNNENNNKNKKNKIDNITNDISLKLSQFGQTNGTKINKNFIKNLKSILNKSKNSKIPIWFDMEDYSTLHSTIKIANILNKNNKYKIGLVLQCYLKNADMIYKSMNCPIRLVKGAYKESTKIVFKHKLDTNKMYSKMMNILIKKGHPTVIATHDNKLIEEACNLIKKYKRKNVEFAFLLGVRTQLQTKLIKLGFKVKVYSPYGKNWIAYYFRRINERKENFFFAIKNLVRK